MASSSSSRAYHQDYIARIRYSNTLPPPPHPPKLLAIPNTGLTSGLYASAGYASRLAREQPLNIEADAELGMPINLVGIPGVFDGDETAIQALDKPPVPHPHDRPLLRPLSTLGKPSSTSSGVSFLRRTEYISSDQSRSRFESTTSTDLVRPKNDSKKRKRSGIDHEDDPAYILQSVTNSFQVASSDLDASAVKMLKDRGIDPEAVKAWNHPTNPNDAELKLLDAYSLLPDLDSFPDTGAYVVTKFSTMPVPASDVYDTRLDVGLLRPLERSAESKAEYEARRAAHEADPTQPKPDPEQWDYEFFIPEDELGRQTFQERWNTADGLDAQEAAIGFTRLRAYETYQQSGDQRGMYGDTVAIALHDEDDPTSNAKRPQTRAAYFYPIVRRSFVRPRRPARSAIGLGPLSQGDTQDQIDYLNVVVRDPGEDELAARGAHRAEHAIPASEGD